MIYKSNNHFKEKKKIRAILHLMAAMCLKRRATKGRKLKSTSWRKTAANQVNWQQVSDVAGHKKRKTEDLIIDSDCTNLEKSLCARPKINIQTARH